MGGRALLREAHPGLLRHAGRDRRAARPRLRRLEEIVETVDSRYSDEIDDYLGIDRTTIARLHDRAYFAQESTLVTEDLKTVACISSPEHRILINEVGDIPPLFVSAILASEDKNFFKHEGIDKAAIMRAFVKHLLQESRSGASTLTMQIAKHLRGGTGRASTEKEKIGDIVMALRIEREFTRQDLLVKYVNMPYFGRGQYGIEAASRAYFGTPAKELTLPQVAFIVALINKPALPDRTFATDPHARDAEQIRDANWAEQARGTVRVLDLMLDQGVINDVEYERAANLVATSLRKEVLPRNIGCGTQDHFLERVRILYKDRFPINKGGLTISITRDDALQDVLAKAVAMTLSTYLARHPDDTDNNQLRAGAYAVEFTGDVLAEVGNVDFKQLKYDIIATGWRQPGSTFKIFTYGGLVERLTKEVLAAEPKTHPPKRSPPRFSSAAPCSMRRSSFRWAADAERRRSRTSTRARSRNTAARSAAGSRWASRATRRRCAQARGPESRT